MNLRIEHDWSLFLDRDGTMNVLRVNDYVKNWNEFEFIDGVLDAIPILNRIFKRTFVATNQQGVGKGLMTERALRKIHVQMLEEITLNGGYIDEIYYCPLLAKDKPECRKPNIGMALQAVKDFSDLNLRKSIMIGDSLSDMQFGKNAGMKTILITDRKQIPEPYERYVDFWSTDLLSTAKQLAHLNGILK